MRRGHPISFHDKSLRCSDCGVTFTHSAADQEFYQSRGFTDAPKRCPECCQARKSKQYGNSNSSYGLRSHEKCFPRFVPIMAREPKYHSNPVRAGRCIVAIAILK